jgi:hypothetical protein
MQEPIGREIHILDLRRGEKYYGFPTRRKDNHFRGIFTDYWTNSVGYKMVHFHNTFSKFNHIPHFSIDTTGPFKAFNIGIYWRVFDNGVQSYKYYRVSRFTEAEKKELLERFVLRQRRQYERGLTGTTNKDVWLPRDLVREISLRYLTDSSIGCAKRWR